MNFNLEQALEELDTNEELAAKALEFLLDGLETALDGKRTLSEALLLTANTAARLLTDNRRQQLSLTEQFGDLLLDHLAARNAEARNA